MNERFFSANPPVSRRQALRAVLGGMGAVSSCGWLPSVAAALANHGERKRHCVLLWMSGGPSQIDTFDLKPGNANGGEFKEAKTSVPGIRISEHLPQLAAMADQLAIVRGVNTSEGDHARGTYLMRTGRRPGTPIRFPSIGSAISKELMREDLSLPGYVSINPSPQINPDAFGPGFLGPKYAAATVGRSGGPPADDAPAGFAQLKVDNLELPAGVDRNQADRRIELWNTLQTGFLAGRSTDAPNAQDTVYRQALRLMKSDDIEAFDLTKESDIVRESYGRGRFGQGCLIARRLIERGVPFVEVTLGDGLGWDTHQNNFDGVRRLSAELDQGWATLMKELNERDLLDSTTILWIGEFGRTPRINDMVGRDHFPNAWTCVYAGGGVNGGHLHGKTSDDGMEVVDGKVSESDIIATLCTALGVDPESENVSELGRPHKISEGGPDPRAALMTVHVNPRIYREDNVSFASNPTNCSGRLRRSVVLVFLALAGLTLMPACGRSTLPPPAPTKPAASETDPQASDVSGHHDAVKPTAPADGESDNDPTAAGDVPTALTKATDSTAAGTADGQNVGTSANSDADVPGDETQDTDQAAEDIAEADVIDEADQPPANQAERVLLLTSQGPLIVDLTMWIDDQPFRHRMEQMIDEVMELGDEDGDGRTTWYELTTSPHLIYGQFGNLVINTERQRQTVVRNYDIIRNDRVDREEIPGFLSQNAGSSRIFALQTMDVDAEPNESAVFKWLDSDTDRRLSKHEIDSAAVRLRLLDANDDDTLAASELSPPEAAAMPRRNRSRYAQKSALLVTPHSDWPALLYLLEERYAFGNPLAPGDFELPGSLFVQLDEDQDREISVKEISRIQQLPAHFAVTASFGAESDAVKHGLDLSQVAEDLQAHVTENKFAKLISLNIAQTEVAISMDDPYPPNPADALMTVWKQADADENEYLDESEFTQVAGFFNVPFAAVDANQDMQLVHDEALSFLKRRESASRSRLQASAGVQPDSLLAYLDRDNDGRLSARETRTLPARLSKLNLDQNEFIDPEEVPVAMSIRISRGVVANQSPPARVEVPRDASADDHAPTWFTQMDTNRDGELSQKNSWAIRKPLES